MLSSVKLTNAHTVRGRPTLKNSTECFRNGLVHELKEKQRKLSRHSMTSKTYGAHRRNDKSKYQECTCEMDKSFNRGMFKTFVSSKICEAGYQSDNSDFDFCNAEHNEFPVSVAGCQQLKPQRTESSFGTTVITMTILFVISILFNRVTVYVLVFVLRAVFFHVIVYIVTRYIYDGVCCDFALSASFVLECFDGSEVATRNSNELVVQNENCVVEEIKEVELRPHRGKFIYKRSYSSVDLNKVSHFSRRGRTPSRLPVKKLKSLLKKTRKVRVFVWKGIRKNTPLSSKIHCYVNNRNGLDLKRYRSTSPKLVRKRGKVYLSSKHQRRGDLSWMRCPSRVLSKYLCFCTCNYPFYSAYKSLNHLVNFEQVKLSTDIEKNPGPSVFVDATKTIHAPYCQGNMLVFGEMLDNNVLQ